MKEARGQSCSLQRYRRLCQIRRNLVVPYGMSLGLVQARPFRVTESTPQLGHADAVSSAVTTCTTRPPNTSDSTRWTARPSKPSRREASDTKSL